jgi:ribosomal protein S27E
MMSDSGGHDPSAAASVSHRVDDVCDRFEAAWKAGQRPPLDAYLGDLPEEHRGRLLQELLAVELSYRRAASEQPEHDEYLRQFPQYGREIEAAFQTTPPAEKSQAEEGTIESSGASRRPLRVCCPHCRNPIEVFDDTPLARIVCSSCGSGFSLVGDEALAYKTTGGTPHRRQNVGRFELIEQLGFGGFGAVWRAHDTRLDRTVAVKIPRKGQLTPDETEKFLREARAAGQLEHPGIVSVHEVGLEDDLVYIVSDFVEGLSLADWLTGQKFTYREAAELCAKIADALHFAHEKGITHRDLKPSNIMLDAAGQPHLMDFGLAKREAGEVTMTLDGVPLGTPAYMSPEQAKGEARQADRRTDVYSLGVILYELLTGERPFRGNVRMLIKQVIEDQPPKPRNLDSHIPRDLETICLKCLEKEPSRRYGTARELAEELRRYLHGADLALVQAESAGGGALRRRGGHAADGHNRIDVFRGPRAVGERPRR